MTCPLFTGLVSASVADFSTTATLLSTAGDCSTFALSAASVATAGFATSSASASCGTEKLVINANAQASALYSFLENLELTLKENTSYFPLIRISVNNHIYKSHKAIL